MGSELLRGGQVIVFIWLVRVGLIEKVRSKDIQGSGNSQGKSSKEYPGVFKEQKGSQCDCSSVSKVSCMRGGQRKNKESDHAGPWRPPQGT